MSDNRPNSIEECIIDITQCPICFEVLVNNRCFPCLHTFCLKCLEVYKKKNAKGKSLPCPLCRREFSIPKGITTLSRNFFIDKLIDAHKLKEIEVLSKNCDICSEDTRVIPATRYCSVCFQHMCLTCEKQHRRISATAMHKIVESTNATDPHNKEFVSRPIYCIAHKTKEADVYCQDCKRAICWKCRSESHSSHTIIEISRAAKDFTTKLEDHIEQISEQLRTKQGDVQQLAEREKLYRDEIDAELTNICKELNKLYRNITDNGDNLKKALTASTSDHLNNFKALRNKVDSDLNRLKKHKVYIEQMIHLGNVSDLLEYTDKLISETARMASENTCIIKVSPVLHLSDLELQDILIGRRTDIDQQYKSNHIKEQLQQHDLHPDKNSKDDKSPKERSNKKRADELKHNKDTEKNSAKTGSENIEVLWVANETAIDISENRAKEESSLSDDTSTWKEVAVAQGKIDSVPYTYCATPELVETVKTSPYYANNSDRSDETSPFRLRRSETHKGTDSKSTKTGWGKIKVLHVTNEAKNYRLENEPVKESSNSDDTITLTEVVITKEKSDSVPQTCSTTSDPTETVAVKTLPNYVNNSDEPFTKYQNWSLQRTVNFENDGPVSGITILNSKLYAVFQNRNNIQVYDLTVVVFRSDFVVNGLVNPNDITSCNFNNCLYICDWSKGRIFRVEIGEGMEQINWSIDTDLGGLSITPEHNVLLSGYISNKLKEYTSKGILIRSINLDVEFKPWHAIRRASSDFVICQGSRSTGFHRVCLIDVNGKLRASFGGVKGSDENRLCGPYHMAIGERDCILVNDCNNRRILLLSQDLKFIKELIPASANVLRRPRRMYLDEVAGRLYVADNAAIGGEIKNGRVLVFTISKI